MREYISLDIHKRYTLGGREGVESRKATYRRIDHVRGIITKYLSDAEPGTAVAVEATGNWYWIVDEIESAGMNPLLVHPYKAKVMLGMINKTDKLDVEGLNRLQRTGTLPTVWIAPSEIRDLRELSRTRMFVSRIRGRLKNRIQATLAKYGLQVTEYSDPFGKSARKETNRRVEVLPPQTKLVTLELLEELDALQKRIEQQEERIEALVKETPEIRRLMTLPGVGKILSVVIALELGDIKRFPRAEQYASYAGTVPRVKASGDKIRYGPLRSDVNRYLKWAYMEAANCVSLHQRNHPDWHVTKLYQRIRGRKGHAKAIGAVSRHLAESTFHMLVKNENYLQPSSRKRIVAKGT